MDYNLAKQLKETGFPQNQNHTALYPYGYVLSGTKKGIKQSQKDRAISPTLSELIEACGDDFIGLLRSDDLKEWRAICPIEKGINVAYNSPSPEEAVARLWLKLNNK